MKLILQYHGFVHLGIGVFQAAILASFKISVKNTWNWLQSSQKPLKQFRINLLKSLDVKYSNTDWFIKVLSKYSFNNWFYLGILPLPPIVRRRVNTESQGFSRRTWKPVVILTVLEVPLLIKTAVKSPSVTNEEIVYLMCWYFFSDYAVRPLVTYSMNAKGQQWKAQ